MAKKSATKAKKRPTIYDLAKMTDVSPGTVSRVLNNKDKVKPGTRERILKAAQILGLKPQSSVRQKLIALVTLPTNDSRFNGYTAILNAHISMALSGLNVSLLIPENPEKDLKNLFLDGIIAISFTKEIYAVLKLMESQTPVVYMDDFQVDRGQYRVRSDHYQAGRLAAEYLIGRGKKRLAFLSPDYAAGRERAKGFTDAIEEAGLNLEKCKICLTGSDSEYATTITRIIRAHADSLFVPGASLEVLRALHFIQFVKGMKVPEDISVIGGENLGITEYLNPPTTTIESPLEKLAAKAVEMIHDLIAGKRPEKSTVDFPVRLIERDSVL